MPIMPEQPTAGEFVGRWKERDLTERASAQSHFIDLCRLLAVPAPTDNRITDSDYGFEARTDVSASGAYATRTENGRPVYQVTTEPGTGRGFVDVWMRDHFCWEYKRPDKYRTLAAALFQVKIYKDSLGNPPLLIVCDINRYEIHTNFTGYPPTVWSFTIDDLLSPSEAWRAAHPHISPLAVLRKVFDDPDSFCPAKTTAAITEERAGEIGKLAIALRDAGNDPHAVAHFLMQIVFCFFAEDIGLLPKRLFTDLIGKSLDDASNFPTKARKLFTAMEHGGSFGIDTIEWFNGGLFKDIEHDPIINIASAWLGTLYMIAKADWDTVEPAIFGTLFERSLDPDKRSQIGAHYTSREDIMLIVEPVVMQPLRRKWVNLQKDVAEWLEQREQKKTERTKKNINTKIEKAILAFADQLGSVRILDPACGSGNFLYVTIQQLLELEKEVRAFAARAEIGVTFTQRINPAQVHGIEINDYAAELARVSIWIGYLQWLHANADATSRRPILDPLETIECRDAILSFADGEGNPIPRWEEGAQCLGPAAWPEADFIIGNPPFLGSKLFRKWGLPDAYIDAMYASFDLPNTSDLCCYWFEMARRMLLPDSPRLAGGSTPGKPGAMCPRVGLLATQGIRGGDNRTVLRRIKETGDIFMAWSDREWVLDGAIVHVSMVGFDDGSERSCTLNSAPVAEINPDLSSGSDVSRAGRLHQNRNIAFMGDTKGGSFDISWETARDMLCSPNPRNISNYEVVRPWVNGLDITRRPRSMFIIDYGVGMEEAEAAAYEGPFQHVERVVKPIRIKNRREAYALKWWIHVEPRPALIRAIAALKRYIGTPIVTKHRLFCWLSGRTVADHQLILFARSDDYFLGTLQSSLHEVWARRAGTQLREATSGFRYTPTTCFETFPLPWPPGEEPEDDPRYIAISEAARELNELRLRWLNPPEWIEPIEKAVDSFEDFSDVPEEARALLRQSAIQARAAKDKRLKKRTLTNLYNERPGWLKLAHRKLDEAVLAAYAAIDDKGEWDTAWAAAYEPFGAGEIVIKPPEVEEAKHGAIEVRREIDEKILGNLLRLNLQRAAEENAES